MDKKNITIGVLLLLGAIASFYFSNKFAAPPPKPGPVPALTSGSSPAADLPKANQPEPVEGPASSATVSPSAAKVSPSAATVPAEYVTIANEFIEVRFTSHGGAIDRIALKKHTAVQGRPELYMLNAAQAAPALSFTDFPGVDRFTSYAVVSQSTGEVVYRAVSDNLEVTRRYSLARAAGQDDYQIRHETVFRNLSDQALTLPRVSLNLGTAAPLNENDMGLYLNTGLFDGEDATFIGRSDLEGGGFLAGVGLKDGTPPAFIEKSAAFVWASVKNQFFALILTPDQPGTGIRAERVKLDPKADPADRQAYGVTSYARFELKPLAAGASETFGASYFAGPKEYKRLSNPDIFKHSEAKVLQFDTYFFNRMFFSGFFAPLLLTIMTWVQSGVGNWGWSIVITTLILKIVFLPFTLAASRSAKRMAKLNPLMQAMREKYKDNPQKIQTETLRLFKENKVNPLGGCIPILITIPFFVGFFAMLQSASDLRFASFLWVADLSAQDTVMRLFGLPLNIMPILMGATMIIQMKLTPTPTTDNAQATMMKIMPWMFTLFCYTFASGLALYSTINGLFTIGQQLIINRLPEPELPAAAEPGAKPGPGSKPGGMKNVTPKKKK